MVALSSACFGMLSIFNRQLAAAGMAVVPILALRFLFGAAALWIFLALRGEIRRLPLKRMLTFGLMGLLYAVGSVLYFESSRRIPVALTALLLYVYPALVMLASWAIWSEKPSAKGILALMFAMAGLGLAVGAPGPAHDALGLAMGLATAFSYTTYLLMGSRLQKGVSPLLSSALILTLAGLTLGTLSYFQGGFHLAPLRSVWPSLAGLVVVCTVVPIPLILAGLSRIGSARTSVISTLEPISAAIFGAWLLGERLGPLQLCGGGLVIAAVILLSRHGTTEAASLNPETTP